MKSGYWIHVDFFFRYGAYLDSDMRFMFEELMRKILIKVKPFIRRKFYLYEPQPDCFLALEMRSKLFIPIVSYFVRKYKKECYFIKYMALHSVSGRDHVNGEGFCDVMSAMTDYYLFKKDAKISHLIHCCLEFQCNNRKIEHEFYKEMAEYYKPFTKRKYVSKGKKNG